MTENEKINGWTFEETIKCAENLMEVETNMFKWDVLRHLRDFAENYKEENQQYHAIGTVEQCQKSVDICKAMIERNITPETIEEYIKFEDECVKKGFTIKSLLESREKAEPRKPICNDLCTCPSCSTHNEVIKKRRNTVVRDTVYCWHCGQAIECQRDIDLD